MLKLQINQETIPQVQEKETLLKAFRESNEMIKTLELNFNQITDHDLLDYYIMMLKAEENRRRFLYKQIREGEKRE